MHDQDEAARRMVDRQLRNRGVKDEAVLEAMLTVPRHRFVPGLEPGDAYADKALPTCQGQTISQPYMVAMMTEQLNVWPGLEVLEIGTGSGYQCAIIAHMGANVVSIERSDVLARHARENLDAAGYGEQVQIITGDGTTGYPLRDPFDCILVTAGAPHLPQAYRDQLADLGRIVIPIGDREEQTLMIFERQGDDWHSQAITRCRFVPLVGQYGWSEPVPS